MFLETFEQLAKVDFKVIVAIGGHYGDPQETSLKWAADEFAKQSEVVVCVLNEADVINDIGIFGDHAGPWETSMDIELCNDLVDLDSFTPGKQPLKRYDIPQRPDGLEFEYRISDFVINADLRTTLGKKQISNQVSLVVDRVGSHALEIY